MPHAAIHHQLNCHTIPSTCCAVQLRQRVGDDAGAKGSSSSKGGSSKGGAEEEDSGYQDAQDALEEMIEEVGGWGGGSEGAFARECAGGWVQRAPSLGALSSATGGPAMLQQGNRGAGVEEREMRWPHHRHRTGRALTSLVHIPPVCQSCLFAGRRRRRRGSWKRLRTCLSTTCSAQPTRRCAVEGGGLWWAMQGAVRMLPLSKRCLRRAANVQGRLACGVAALPACCPAPLVPIERGALLMLLLKRGTSPVRTYAALCAE